MPCGTVGGRIALTAKPECCRYSAAAKAASFSPMTAGTICVALPIVSQPSRRKDFAKSADREINSARSRSMVIANRSAARICAAIYGGMAVLKINVRA